MVLVRPSMRSFDLWSQDDKYSLIITVDGAEQVGGVQGVNNVLIDDEGGCGETPVEIIETGSEGIGHDVVVVDEASFGVAGTIGDTPAEGLGRAGEDLGLAGTILGFDPG